MEREHVDTLLDYLHVPSWGRKWQGPNRMFLCPLHDDHRASAGIHPEKEVFSCFLCGGRSLPWLIHEVHGVPYPAAVHLLREKFGGGVLSWDEIRQRASKEPRPFPEPSYFSEFQLSCLPEADLTARGIHSRTSRRFNVRLHSRFRALLFPWYGYPTKLYAGHSVRLLDGDRRYIQPKGLQKSRHLYGLWESGVGEAWRKGRRQDVVVAEGPFDVMALVQAGLPAVGLFGCLVSSDQSRLLKHARRLVLFLDHDRGGLSGCWRAWKHLRHSVPLWLARYPADTGGADPGELPRDDLRWGVEHAVRVTPAALRNFFA